jgi:DeoR/GlpR family transcriptional regulator of sugar metabolism
MLTIDLPEERRELILDELSRNGKVVAKELSSRYGVSEDTIRRDLDELAGTGMLKRVHGGALPLTPSRGPYYERDRQHLEAKPGLARAAGSLVKDGQLILFGGGTMNAEIAKNLPLELHATAATTSPLIALYLMEYPHIDVIMIGGHMNRRELVTCGIETTDKIRDFQADICYLGVCGVHPEVGITSTLYEEVDLVRALIEQSGEVVATLTADKLGAIAPFTVAPAENITHIVTEKRSRTKRWNLIGHWGLKSSGQIEIP